MSKIKKPQRRSPLSDGKAKHVSSLKTVCHPEVLTVFRLAIAESDRAPEIARTLDSNGHEANRKALTDLVRKAQARVLRSGEQSSTSAGAVLRKASMQYSSPHQMARRASQYQHSRPLAANLGLARPPAIYLTAIVTGLGLHFAWPIPFVPSLAMSFAAVIAAFAVMLFIWSIRTFHSAGTPVPGNRPTTAIVRVGPYRFSRNPSISRSRCFRLESRSGSTTLGSWSRCSRRFQ
jgi:hypothetical protein